MYRVFFPIKQTNIENIAQSIEARIADFFGNYRPIEKRRIIAIAITDTKMRYRFLCQDVTHWLAKSSIK